MHRIALIVALGLVAAASVHAQLERVDPWGYGASDLHDAIALDASTILVAGEDVVLRSEDAGRTWSIVESTTGALYRIVPASATVALALGAEGMILRTTDGGRTWSRVGSGVEQLLLDGVFVTPSSGIVVGSRGTILRTSDGGATWRRDSIGHDRYLYDIDVTPSGALAIGASGGVMFISDDAGLTWRARSTGLVENLLAIHMLDTSRGWAGTSGGIVHTTDAGATWTRQLADRSIQSLHVVSPTKGYAAASDGSVYVSDDGTSWRRADIGDSATLHAVLAVGTNILAVGELGSIARSSDAGATWTQTGTRHREHLYAIDVENDHRGFAVGQRGLVLRTSDGGTTWSQLRIPGEPGLAAVATGEGRRVWAAGADRMVYRSEDDGQTWTGQQVPELAGVAELAHTQGVTLWAAGGGGVFVTTDGGLTWEKRYSDTARFFYSVAAETTGEVVVVADSGLAVRSSDGGASWQRIATATSANLYDCALAGGTATLAGEGGTVVTVDPASGSVSRVVVDSLVETVWAILPGAEVISTTGGDLVRREQPARWRALSTGLPARGLDATDRAVFAAGASGSIWRMERVAVSVPIETSSPAALIIAPNPAGDVIEVTLAPSTERPARLRMIGSDGAIHRSVEPDGGVVRLSTVGLPAGVYTIEAIARDGGVAAQGRVVIVR